MEGRGAGRDSAAAKVAAEDLLSFKQGYRSVAEQMGILEGPQLIWKAICS